MNDETQVEVLIALLKKDNISLQGRTFFYEPGMIEMRIRNNGWLRVDFVMDGVALHREIMKFEHHSFLSSGDLESIRIGIDLLISDLENGRCAMRN